MFLEVHLLQNFALSNLNRDDTGAPKSCIFAGSRRARISSQCLKRAVRTSVREEGMVPSEQLAYRTKKIVSLLIKHLTAAGLNEEEASIVAQNAIEGIKFNLANGKTEYLLMVSEREVEKLVKICSENVEKLNRPRKRTDKEKDKEIDKELAKQLLNALDGGEAVDIALFGRMVATHQDKSIDAAVQMAHAFSTNVIANEFDFYTAVDDLQQKTDDEGAGAAMMGTILYNSSCYYRYTNLDFKQLSTNLNKKSDMVITAIQAFLEGMVKAVPTGKQTNTAAQNPPALIMAVVRDSGLWSLANAFTTPVRNNIIEVSAKQLFNHWEQLATLYGVEGIHYAGYATYLPEKVLDNNLTHCPARERNFAELKKRVAEEILSEC